VRLEESRPIPDLDGCGSRSFFVQFPFQFDRQIVVVGWNARPVSHLLFAPLTPNTPCMTASGPLLRSAWPSFGTSMPPPHPEPPKSFTFQLPGKILLPCFRRTALLNQPIQLGLLVTIPSVSPVQAQVSESTVLFLNPYIRAALL